VHGAQNSRDAGYDGSRQHEFTRIRRGGTHAKRPPPSLGTSQRREGWDVREGQRRLLNQVASAGEFHTWDGIVRERLFGEQRCPWYGTPCVAHVSSVWDDHSNTRDHLRLTSSGERLVGSNPEQIGAIRTRCSILMNLMTRFIMSGRLIALRANSGPGLRQRSRAAASSPNCRQRTRRRPTRSFAWPRPASPRHGQEGGAHSNASPVPPPPGSWAVASARTVFRDGLGRT
jgi:hypothetical protein